MSEPPSRSEVVAVVADMIARDGPAQALGVVVELAAEGRAVARMRVRADMVNGNGQVHGGMVFTLADVAFACASNSHGPVSVAAGASIEFLRPAALGDELVAVAVERLQSGRTRLYDVTVRSGESVIAEMRGRSTELRTRS
jgi:acyl-CoA thioesterase